jgi:hypothetical protein
MMTEADRETMTALLRCREALRAAQEAHTHTRKYGPYHRAYLELGQLAKELRDGLSDSPLEAQNRPPGAWKGIQP